MFRFRNPFAKQKKIRVRVMVDSRVSLVPIDWDFCCKELKRKFGKTVMPAHLYRKWESNYPDDWDYEHMQLEYASMKYDHCPFCDAPMDITVTRK